jgi:hypothetical protein
LGEEHRLRVFENRVLRKIFGPKREEDGSWRKLHNDELHNLYSSPNIVRVIKSGRMNVHGINDIRHECEQLNHYELKLVLLTLKCYCKLKSYKSPSIHQIAAEFIQTGGNTSTLHSEIHKLIHCIWNK